MFNHAPKNYQCPFCLLAKGIENGHVVSRQSDIIYRDKFVTALVASQTWPNNHGHVIVIPNRHYENIYDIPGNILLKIHSLEKRMALAMKSVFKADGVSFRQQNEPDGGQDVWHYHLHVFPRYKNDKLYELNRKRIEVPPAVRSRYAKKLRAYLKINI